MVDHAALGTVHETTEPPSGNKPARCGNKTSTLAIRVTTTTCVHSTSQAYWSDASKALNAQTIEFGALLEDTAHSLFPLHVECFSSRDIHRERVTKATAKTNCLQHQRNSATTRARARTHTVPNVSPTHHRQQQQQQQQQQPTTLR